MNQQQSSDEHKRRRTVRRHRRERQIVVFGVIAIAVGAVAFAAAAVYQGDVEGPFSEAFHTPAGEFESDVTLVCPPPGALPLPYNEVVVRVNNGTDTSGLAGNTADTLEGRGFTVVGAVNWSREYDGTARIMFGEDGVQHAYTLARQFEDADLVLDSREDITVDLVVGTAFAERPQLRELLAPELDPELPLTADAECLPANLVVAEPAPRVLPENPLAEEEAKEEDNGDGEGGEG